MKMKLKLTTSQYCSVGRIIAGGILVNSGLIAIISAIQGEFNIAASLITGGATPAYLACDGLQKEAIKSELLNEIRNYFPSYKKKINK